MGYWNKPLQMLLTSGLILGIFCSAIVQGNPNRRWSVRKTGEFGRRVDPLSKELQLPSKQFRLHELNLDLSETRRYDQQQAHSEQYVRRPSLNLELPQYNSVLSSDQEAQETGEGEGYAYAKPDQGSGETATGGYSYPRPNPSAKLYPDDPESTTSTPPRPNPVEPNDAVAGLFTPLEPVEPVAGFNRETDEDIDSQGLRPSPRPVSPQVAEIVSNKDSCTDYNDPNCWTHDYSDVIPGVAGTDYPVLSEIVDTNFDCDQQEYSGYYADFDEQARCQVFHICLKRSNYRKTQKWSFLCPNGTIFSQRELVCVLWTDADCEAGNVRSLYNINQELGWDNITEAIGNKIGGRTGNGELQTAMSAFRAASSAAKLAAAASSSSTRTGGLPYRVPVKVNEEAGRARTKLQEVVKNPLHGSAYELDYGDNTEHEVEESSNFETSLRKQSEAQRKTKSGSALHKSISEAYELKGSPDGVQPFIVNRPRGHSSSGYPPDNEYDGEQTERPPHQVFMMPARQRLPDGTDGYANVPVMLPNPDSSDDSSDGYYYPNPNEKVNTPPPTYLPPTTTQRSFTTTEDFLPPTIPTEPPLDHENYENEYQNSDTSSPTTENTGENGYYYPNPTSTDRTEESDSAALQQNNRLESDRYENQYQANDEQTEGYRYPQPTTTESSEAGYQYPESNPMDATPENEEGYKYPVPTSTETSTEDGYRYQQPTTTETQEEEDGYRYPKPSSPAKSASRLRNTAAPTTTEQTAVTDESDSGYQYPTPGEQLGYDSPTSTDRSFDNSQQYLNDQYQVTDNEVSGGYNTESTTRSTAPERKKNLVADNTTEEPIVSTTPENEIPAGGYLPPINEAPNSKQVEVDEDTVGITGGGEDYDEEANELVTGPTGPTAEEADSGYSYNYPTPPAQLSQTTGGGGGALGTYSQHYITNIRQEYKRRQKVVGSYYNGNYNGNAIDSDEKVNEILKQIQNGGIEAVDANGQPIPFDKLKQLLLTSPPGSVELKGDIDSVTSPSTEIPTSPQTEQPTYPQQQEENNNKNTPTYHTVTTATILPNNNNNNFNNNAPANTITTTGPANNGVHSSSSSFYSSPNANNNNAQRQQQPYFTTNNNNNNLLFEQPTYEINVPNREFETHSVLTNTIDSNSNKNNNNNNNNFFTSPPNQYQAPQIQNVQYELPQQRPPTPQQQFFPSQTFHSTPTLSTSLVIPKESYLPPASREPPSGFDSSPPPTAINNLVIPSSQSQQQYQQQQQQYQQRQPQAQTTAPTFLFQQPNGEYLPPRQESASILQSQYYSGEASSSSSSTSSQSQSQSTRNFVSPPIQLTENIQLQQSFAQPLNIGNIGAKENPNPLVNPKDIKIVPALFVHQHTSVASQNQNQLREGSSQQQQQQGIEIENGFQNLDTAQSVYPPSNSASKFGSRDYLAEQLNQLANSVYSPPTNGVGRQFTRRSNGNSGSSKGRSSSTSSAEPSHTIEKATQVTTFTLEDARSPDELQKYHHEDLKRFHSENIAKQGRGVFDDSYVAPPPTTERPSPPQNFNIPRVQHRFVTQTPSRTSPVANDHGSGRRNVNTNESQRSRNNGNGRRGGSSSNSPSRLPTTTDTHSSNQGSSSSSNRGRSNNEEYFIPVSGSYAGGRGGGGSSSRGGISNNNDSQFRVNNGRSSGGGGGRSYLDSEPEHTLLKRFLPENEGGFGARIL